MYKASKMSGAYVKNLFYKVCKVKTEKSKKSIKNKKKGNKKIQIIMRLHNNFKNEMKIKICLFIKL